MRTKNVGLKPLKEMVILRLLLHATAADKGDVPMFENFWHLPVPGCCLEDCATVPCVLS